jgi:hypothetical protein
MEILEDLVIPCIVKDHNSKTAIVVRSGRKYVHIIPMKSGKLTVKKLTPAQFVKQQYTVLDIPLQVALKQYMLHSGGYTETARLELEKISCYDA